MTETVLNVKNYIGGQWREASSGRTYLRENPATPGEIVASLPDSAEEDMNAAVEAAHAAFLRWSKLPASQRAKYLFGFAELLEANKEEVAELLTREQGKPLRESLGEVGKTVQEVRFTAGEALRLAGETLPSERPNIHIRTIRVPKGVIAAISPWNFPVVTPLRKIAPALAAGNTVVFKPAGITSATAAKVVLLFEQAGLPDGVLNLLIGSGSRVGTPLVTHPLVRGVTFTGSTEIGSTIYKRAAEKLIEVQLEMGGKNAAIVYDYSDMDNALNQILSAASAASGQRCTAISRVIVQRSQLDKVVGMLADKVSSYAIGNGLDNAVNLGPLVSKQQLEIVEKYVKIGLEEGAKLVCGGHRLTNSDNGGYFHEFTIFSDVTPNMRIAKEEIFGPVITVQPVDSFDEAIQIANDTEYGLAATCFTENMRYAEQFVNEVETGMLHLNNGTVSESHVPFGGLKHSAIGPYSIGSTSKDFFTNLKVVYTSAV